jgi:AcrR family transcriptional regulator
MAKTGEPGDDFAVAYRRALAHLRRRVEAACAAQPERPERIAAGVRAAFAFAVDQPDTARLLTDEALSRGESGQAEYRGMVACFAALLRSGMGAGAGASQGTVAGEAIIGGLALLIGSRLRNGREGELADTAADAVQLVLTPYIGIEQARRVAVGRH